MNFQKLEKLVDLRGKTKRNGSYNDYGVGSKTDIAVHHSLTKDGSSAAFANYHVDNNKWPGVAYHFVIRLDGTIEWNHNLGVCSYHVGASNKFALGICVVGDFRTMQPTDAQKRSLAQLVNALKKDLPNYARTRGHNEFVGYSWKLCPLFDYRAVVNNAELIAPVKPAPVPNTYVIQQGDTFWSIANELPGVSMNDLIASNPSVNPARLQIGQRINLAKGKAPTPKPAPRKEYVELPRTAQTWRTYRLNVQPVARNSDWSLTPSVFGGLKYEILGRPFPDVVTINTSRGKRNIFVAPSTGARITWEAK